MAKLEFRCSIAATMTSLKFGGDTARITIEVPKCDVDKAVGMIALQGAPLIASFEVDNGIALSGSKDYGEDGSTKGKGTSQANRKQTECRSARRPTDVDSR